MITMINVVFLLLAFFMLGQFLPNRPESIQLPLATTGERAEFDDIIFLGQDGDFPEESEVSDLSGRSVLVSVDRAVDANILIKNQAMLRSKGAKIVAIEVSQ